MLSFKVENEWICKWLMVVYNWRKKEMVVIRPDSEIFISCHSSVSVNIISFLFSLVKRIRYARSIFLRFFLFCSVVVAPLMSQKKKMINHVIFLRKWIWKWHQTWRNRDANRCHLYIYYIFFLFFYGHQLPLFFSAHLLFLLIHISHIRNSIEWHKISYNWNFHFISLINNWVISFNCRLFRATSQEMTRSHFSMEFKVKKKSDTLQQII